MPATDAVSLVVGLGNPGERYERTRHNVGFLAVDAFAEHYRASWSPAETGRGLAARLEFEGRTLRLAKPQTYMNASGEMVGALARFFKVAPEAILVVSDDFNLPLGRLRLRLKGSAGGQNGLDSILTHLGTQSVPRLRLGIGPVPPKQDPANFVLGKFASSEAEAVASMISRSVEAIAEACRGGVAQAMNRFNGAEA